VNDFFGLLHELHGISPLHKLQQHSAQSLQPVRIVRSLRCKTFFHVSINCSKQNSFETVLKLF